jgi:hypothetical protein
MSVTTSKYEPPPTHDLNAEEQEYIKSLTPRELALHKASVANLGSSYFVWKSSGFLSWKQSKNANSK